MLGRDDAHSDGVRGSGSLAQASEIALSPQSAASYRVFSYDFDRVLGSMLIDEADSAGASHESSLPYYSPCVRLIATGLSLGTRASTVLGAARKR